MPQLQHNKKRLVAKLVEPEQVLRAKPVPQGRIMKAKPVDSGRRYREVNEARSEPKEKKGFWAEVWGSLSPMGKIKTAIGLGIMGIALFVYIPLMLLQGLAR